MNPWVVLGIVVLVVLVAMAVVDVVQTKHAVRRNYPLIGRFRYLLEKIGPELRQYIVTSNDEERPFSRDQRRWVYASAKKENQYFGFGTDTNLYVPRNIFIRHAAFPYQRPDHASGSVDADHEVGHRLPSAKVVGEWRDRTKAFRPESIVNISAMSFGSLSGVAVESLNRGAALAGCLHNTGEGGVSSHHLRGGDLIYQLGTGYFGARDREGRFDMDAAVALVETAPIKAIEIKLSQGAKPGLGGVLPGSKVTAEIAAARGVPEGVTVASPARHTAFDSVPTMVEFIERLAGASGVPVGIKSAVGERAFWVELADHMVETGRGPDFITIDGGEGGTGAAPLVFTDHVSLPFRAAIAQVYSTFAERDLHEKVVWIGSGRLGFPGEALLAMAMGADLINVGREAMLAVGCIQAQRCHTGHCPTGVATHNAWLTRGLDPADKSVRAGNYVMGLRHEILQLTHACGQPHPSLVGGTEIDLVVDGDNTRGLWDRYGYREEWFAGRRDEFEALEILMK